ncbi:MAG TPA: chemotaxis protein CheW [Actinomycetota bacterium]|nr:chemotaxis protein CheW [Actinomycetota bacterium]
MDVGRTSVLSGRTATSLEGAHEGGTARHTLVVFGLDDRDFALPIEDIAEVVPMVLITPVPEVPPWVEGVINLRGRVIPIVDLRRRLAMEPLPHALNTPILIAEQGTRKLGLIVDEIRDVVSLGDEDLEPPAEVALDPTGNAEAVSAVGRLGERLIVVLDLMRVTGDAAPLAEDRRAADVG